MGKTTVLHKEPAINKILVYGTGVSEKELRSTMNDMNRSGFSTNVCELHYSGKAKGGIRVETGHSEVARIRHKAFSAKEILDALKGIQRSASGLSVEETVLSSIKSLGRATYDVDKIRKESEELWDSLD